MYRRPLDYNPKSLDPALSMADKLWLILKDELVEGTPDELVSAGFISRLFESSFITFDPLSWKPAIKH